MEKTIQTLDKYTGHKNKAGLYQKIINQIPKHDIYAEFFAGSASVFDLITVPAAKNILNDINAEVYQLLVEKYQNTSFLICCYDAIKLLKLSLKTSNKKFFNKDFFVFLDPPYLHETRPNGTNLYKHEMTKIDHVQLLSNCLVMKCNLMIIHPKCELYEKMLFNWRKIEVKVRYNKKTSIECLYMNYPEPAELQDYSYLGNNCWDRQRIKRKVENYVEKFKKLPVLDRNHIINNLKKI